MRCFSVVADFSPFDKPSLICLLGPTASGKTDLAIQLADELDCELISVDSVLVYRGMNIGSAKPNYPHHLVDICDPAEPYSAADFAADAERLIEEITDRGKIPLLVGGTMLYFRALLEGIAEMPATDPATRADIESRARREGWPAMHAALAAVDAASASRIHPNHSQRIARALEVYESSGKPLSQWHREGENRGIRDKFRVHQLAICPADRALLHTRIQARFDAMMKAGLLDEVRELHARSELHADLPAMRAVGYRQLWEFLEGQLSLEEAVQNAVSATRQLAKRQLTWLRKWPDLAWIITDHAGNVSSESEQLETQSRSPLQAAMNYLEIPAT